MLLEVVEDEWDDVIPFEVAVGAVGIGVGVAVCGFRGGAVQRRLGKAERDVHGQVQVEPVRMHVLALVLLFEKFCGVLRVFDRSDFETVAEVGRGCRPPDAACRVLPRAVKRPVSAQYDVVVACRSKFQVVESGEQRERLELVIDFGGELVPGAPGFALLVVGQAFARVVEVVVDIAVHVVVAHHDAGVEMEGLRKVAIKKQADEHGVVVVRRGVREVGDEYGVRYLCADVDEMILGGIRESEVRYRGLPLFCCEAFCSEERYKDGQQGRHAGSLF